MKLYIKNMVCSRCRMVVQSELEKAGIQFLSVELGEIELSKEPTGTQHEKLNAGLKHFGFELIDDKKSRMIEKIKNAIVQLIHHNNDTIKTNLSDFIAEKLHYDYSYLSNLFSEVEGTTIEKYFITQRIERVKELLEDKLQSLDSD